jgi:hypothetical protein
VVGTLTGALLRNSGYLAFIQLLAWPYGHCKVGVGKLPSQSALARPLVCETFLDKLTLVVLSNLFGLDRTHEYVNHNFFDYRGSRVPDCI